MTHTRTSTDAGPDYCAECSEAIQNWVTWPCEPSLAQQARSDQLRSEFERLNGDGSSVEPL